MAEEITVDTTGLRCPLPVLRAKKAMRPLASGDRATVIATDPASQKDFRAFCDTTGYRLLEDSEAGGVFRYVIEKV